MGGDALLTAIAARCGHSQRTGGGRSATAAWHLVGQRAVAESASRGAQRLRGAGSTDLVSGVDQEPRQADRAILPHEPNQASQQRRQTIALRVRECQEPPRR